MCQLNNPNMKLMFSMPATQEKTPKQKKQKKQKPCLTISPTSNIRSFETYQGLNEHLILKSKKLEFDSYDLLQLQSFGANLNIQDQYLMSPLMYASNIGNVNIVDTLLQNGVDPNLIDICGNTALHCAVWGSLTYADKFLNSQFSAITSLLIEYNIDIFKKNNLNLSALDLAVSEKNYSLAIDIVTTVDILFSKKVTI